MAGASGVPVVQVPQLDFQHGALDAFHPRVVAQFDVMVAAGLGVVAQAADALGQGSRRRSTTAPPSPKAPRFLPG